MSRFTVAGGLYHECCVWPDWNRVLGSGGRAAAAVVGHVDAIAFHTYASEIAVEEFRPQAEIGNLDFRPEDVDQLISFEYVHSLSTPVITPSPSRIVRQEPIDVAAEVVLRFGMLEGTARVEAERCVYDPQSAGPPERFEDNGSHAKTLAIVGNRREICELAAADRPLDAGARLVEEGAEVVVVKSGAAGAQVITASGATSVPAYRSNAAWTLGSGDVFTAMFAAIWAVHRDSPVEAARLASAAVSSYAENRELQVPPIEALLRREALATEVTRGKVYLASPFFTVSQLWLVDEVRRGLRDLGLEVFSPLHEIGPGPAGEVAPADIAALKDCDIVFAVLDGLDSGTVFEIGYARALEKPVYALAQKVSTGDLTMIEGSGCHVYHDLVTALHHAAWRE